MSTTPFTYKTIRAPTTSLFKDRGSKFLGFCFPIDKVEDVKKHVKSLKKEHPKANHYCIGFRIGTDGTSYRANDDGEPSGSAGRPILGQIDSAGLTNVLIVVVRYFGGTLLGVPGLIHAYKTVAADCLGLAEIVEKDIELPVILEFDYSLMNEVMQVLKQYEVAIYEQEMLLFCVFSVGIPLVTKEECWRKLQGIQGLEIRS